MTDNNENSNGNIDYGKLATKLANSAGKITRKVVDTGVSIVRPENIKKAGAAARTLADSAAEGWNAAAEEDRVQAPTDAIADKVKSGYTHVDATVDDTVDKIVDKTSVIARETASAVRTGVDDARRGFEAASATVETDDTHTDASTEDKTGDKAEDKTEDTAGDKTDTTDAK